MIIVSVWKVVAVLLLCTHQTFCTSSAIYDETSEATTCKVLTRLRRTLIGTGGGGITQNKPPTPLTVNQNYIAPTPLSFRLTINFSRNNISVLSNNFKAVDVTTTPQVPTTRPPTTSKLIPTKLSTTQKPKALRATSPNPRPVSHFRKLPKPNKGKRPDEANEVPAQKQDLLSINNDTIDDVTSTNTTETTATIDLKTENVEVFLPTDLIDPELNLEDVERIMNFAETTDTPINTDSLTSLRSILSIDRIPTEPPVNTDISPGFRTLGGRTMTKTRGPKTMANIRRSRLKGSNP